MKQSASAQNNPPPLSEISAFAIPGLPIFSAGDRLAATTVEHAIRNERPLRTGDVVVVAQKVVSKVEGREVALSDVKPSSEAIALAKEAQKDPRLVEMILSESNKVLRVRPGLIIVEHKIGIVLANAGIDRSNVCDQQGSQSVLLLPKDPQGSAQQLRGEFREFAGIDVAVIINDSIGRAWRNGTVGTAIGVSGLGSVADLRGRADLFGRPMETSMVATADQIASMAALLQGECDEGQPVVVCRGLHAFFAPGDAGQLVRSLKEDMFR